MKIINRENIDIQKWDELVAAFAGNSVFSLSSYLDATAENWCILVDEQYTKGIAVPFSVRMGVSLAYTPIFVRYLDWLGDDKMDDQQLIDLLKIYFRQGAIAVSIADPRNDDDYVFQQIEPASELALNSQAKRMLTKFEKSGMQIVALEDEKEILAIIHAELPQKISSINSKSLQALSQLIENMKQQKILKIIGVKKDEVLVGGVFLIEFNDSILYLKGAFSEDSKKEGAMYAVMHSAIFEAKVKNKTFDFGGSRVEGVRRFNLNLGGEDRFYRFLEWNNAPRWFGWLKIIRQQWKRK